MLWNGDGYVEVIVSGIYSEKTCGLCGNFNNFPEDDMRTPTNEIVTSESRFGSSWKVILHFISFFIHFVLLFVSLTIFVSFKKLL